MPVETPNPPTSKRVYSREEYLKREAVAEAKSEYHAGRIVAMAGVDLDHDHIVYDLNVSLGSQLLRTTCEGMTSEVRLWAPACNKYHYPDSTIACGEAQYEMLAGVRSLMNPVAIIEVLSKSTERYDRGGKWMCYQTIESLQVYVLISRLAPVVEAFRRTNEGWLYQSVQGLDAVLPLPEIGCEIRLADIYRRIDFDEAPDSDRADEVGDFRDV